MNIKMKGFKKLINSKLLYTLPLAGAGLLSTQQSVHAMFNPPNKQPTVKHFVPITSSSTSSTSATAPRTWRSQLHTTPSSSSGHPLTSTTNPTPWRSTSNSSTSYASRTNTNTSPTPSSNPNRQTGSRVSGLVARFESLSNSQPTGTRPAPTPSASDSRTTLAPNPIPTPDYNRLGAKPKTSSKTSTTNASSKKEESTLRTTARNFSDFIKDSTKNALEEELSRELNFMLSENRGSSGETIDQTVANTWKLVFETSKDIFQSEMRKELSLRNIVLNERGEQDLIKASEDFGKYMGNTAATQLKRAALGFSEVAVTENNIPEVILKIQKVSESLGDNMASHIFREFLTSAFDFMVNHSPSNDF